jgi:hypothetical protein
VTGTLRDGGVVLESGPIGSYPSGPALPPIELPLAMNANVAVPLTEGMLPVVQAPPSGTLTLHLEAVFVTAEARRVVGAADVPVPYGTTVR